MTRLLISVISPHVLFLIGCTCSLSGTNKLVLNRQNSAGGEMFTFLPPGITLEGDQHLLLV